MLNQLFMIYIFVTLIYAQKFALSSKRRNTLLSIIAHNSKVSVPKPTIIHRILPPYKLQS